MGRVDGFIGDGHLKKATEALLDIFYSLHVFKSVWVAADYQLLVNPGYNADRSGPIHMPGFQIHAEF
jgi:high affinity Mn2+ porin